MSERLGLASCYRRQGSNGSEQVPDRLISDLGGIDALDVVRDDVALDELEDLHRAFDDDAMLLDLPEHLACADHTSFEEAVAGDGPGV